jgi:ABC-type uncharacterized transport system fused permease/ATPase subunit
MYKGMYKEKKTIYIKLNNLLKIQIQFSFYKSILDYFYALSTSFGSTYSHLFILFQYYFNLLIFNDKLFQYLMNSFTLTRQSFKVMMGFISLGSNISNHAGYTSRVGELLEYFEKLKNLYESNNECYEYISENQNEENENESENKFLIEKRIEKNNEIKNEKK